MKRILNNKYKLVLIILILIIVIGIINLAISGFKKGIEFSAGTRIEIYLEKGYDKNDIINISKECFPNRDIAVNEIEKLGQVVGIKVQDYTEEELNNFKTKIAEKYQIEADKLELYEVSIPEVKIMAVIKPYILSYVISTILVLIYVGIRNIKEQKVLEAILKTILSLIIILGVYFSIILIFKIPFGMYTMPIALAIYIITLLVSASKISK